MATTTVPQGSVSGPFVFRILEDCPITQRWYESNNNKINNTAVNKCNKYIDLMFDWFAGTISLTIATKANQALESYGNTRMKLGIIPWLEQNWDIQIKEVQRKNKYYIV